MDSQQLHRSFLRHLLSLRDDCVQQVRLVSRLCDDALFGDVPAERLFVFLPDLHLLSRAAEAQYRYGFHTLEPGRFVQRQVLLDRLCEAILTFRQQLPAEHSLKTVQLGDFLDLWRENEFAQEDLTALVARILDDNPEARGRLVRTDAASLEPDVLLGNHDLKMLDSSELSHARRAFTYTVGGRRALLVTHGDLFDGLETFLDDDLQEWFLERFGHDVPAQRYKLDRTTAQSEGEMTGSEGSAPTVLAHEEEDLPAVVNIWVTTPSSDGGTLANSHRLLPTALEYAAGLRAGSSSHLDAMGLDSPLPELRLMVVGHSHQARLCLHRDALEPSNTLVFMDCGAWIESAQFGDAVVPSCQIGVLCGGDMRLYQLDPHTGLL